MLSGMKIVQSDDFHTLRRKMEEFDSVELRKQEDIDHLEKIKSLLFLWIMEASRNQDWHWYQLWTIQVNHPWDDAHERGPQNSLHWSRKWLRHWVEVLTQNVETQKEFLIIHYIILNEDKYFNSGKDSLYIICGSLHKHLYIYSTKPEQFRAEDKCRSFLWYLSGTIYQPIFQKKNTSRIS